MRPCVTAKKLRRRGWRTGTRVEQHDVYLTAGKRLGDHRQGAEYERQKSEPQAALDHHQHVFHPRMRHHISDTQREHRSAAEVDASRIRRMRAVLDRIAVVEQAEAADDYRRPNREKK